MESEALRNIRTMRKIKTGLDIAREQKARTTNSLSGTKEEIEYLESIEHPELSGLLLKERRRFATYDASVEKSHQRLLQLRKKLASIVNKNRALMELRRQLQQARWAKDPPSPSPKRNPNPQNRKYRKVHFNY